MPVCGISVRPSREVLRQNKAQDDNAWGSGAEKDGADGPFPVKISTALTIPANFLKDGD